MDESETERPPRERVKIFGRTDTELIVSHRDFPQYAVERFLDGWVTGKRNEPFNHMRHNKRKPLDSDWNYGYELAQSRTVYFSQALHSFLVKLERERRV